MAFIPMRKKIKSSEVEIVSFTDGTDAQIAAMLNAYYDNQIVWEDMGWAVGDVRKIHINAIPYPSTASAQDINIVIVAHDHTDLATPINGHTKACITVQTREVLHNYTNKNTDSTNGKYMNGNSDLDRTYTKWSEINMRNYLNVVVWNAIPSSDFKSAIKPSNHYRHTEYNTDSSELVTDTLFLPSYPEVFGTETYYYYKITSPGEGTQFDYYKNSSNRIKQGNNNGVKNGTNVRWWLGSSSSYWDRTQYYYWLAVAHIGVAVDLYGSIAVGVSPAWAM